MRSMLSEFFRNWSNVPTEASNAVFLHGWRHASQVSRERIDCLEKVEYLNLVLELATLIGTVAAQIQTLDYHTIGWPLAVSSRTWQPLQKRTWNIQPGSCMLIVSPGHRWNAP